MGVLKTSMMDEVLRRNDAEGTLRKEKKKKKKNEKKKCSKCRFTLSTRSL